MSFSKTLSCVFLLNFLLLANYLHEKKIIIYVKRNNYLREHKYFSS